MAEKVINNPFFEEYKTSFKVPPFDTIQVEHYLPALTQGIEDEKREIEEIINNNEIPNFENTIKALDKTGILLQKVSPVFFGMLNAMTNEGMQKIAKEIKPKLTMHRDNIRMNQKLFKKVKTIYQNRDSLELSSKQKTLVTQFYNNFVRGGAALNEKQRSELGNINKELSLLTLRFSENILKETNKFKMVLEKEEDLDGLPLTVISTAAETAKQNGYEGNKWLFTVHKPSLIPFLQYSKKRKLREKIFKAYIMRGDQNDELDNKNIAAKIASLRVKKANLLGYKTYADYVLDDRMAKETEKVYSFLNKLWQPALDRAKTELNQLQDMVIKEGKDFKIQPWDWWYYAEKLRKEKYGLDEEQIRPYFKLENVRDGAFSVATKLYNIKFKELHNVPVYHEEVKVFEVTEADGSHIGVFYVDFHPRASKRSGAWSGTFRKQYKLDNKKITPVVTNVCNFSKPTGKKPALLSFDEVETLFHEFGHALHSLFDDTDFRKFRLPTDFVELPSQIMENWASEPEVLKMYAKHYQTGDPIPDELITKINNSRLFNQGFITVEYLAASLLDMDWHTLDDTKDVNTNQFELDSIKKMGLIPEIISRYRSSYFAHIFGGNYYSAGYYSYIWAQVLDSDAFEAFKETSLFEPEIAKSFRDNILSQGGSDDPMEMYIRFRGAEPKIEPLLRRRGLV